MTPERYLLVTHIPFVRQDAGAVTLDGLWARDLQGMAESLGRIRVAAPELSVGDKHNTWGPTAATLGPHDNIDFAGLPPIRSRRDLWRWPAVRNVLRKEVAQADLVHTSNFFPPYLGLSYAHDFAAAQGKKTLFVIAEDFQDMLQWEWLRESCGAVERWRRRRDLRRLDRRVAKSARSASLTFLHTPAAVTRYRLETRNGIAIRQPGHEAEDVIDAVAFRERCAQAQAGAPLTVIAACRHKPLKGIDFLISAIALLAEQGLHVEVRIYGQGNSTGSWKSLAQRLGVADRVQFCGPLEPGPAVYRAIQQGHIFAMPHRTTDFGRAFFDAMAGGTPVVAFRTPASLDTVRDGVDGFLTPPDDVEGLAAALRRLHCDRALLIRASHAARDRALTNTRTQWCRLRAGWDPGALRFSNGTHMMTKEQHTANVRESISTNVIITIVARVVYLITRFFVPPFVLARISMEAYGLWATAFILVSYIGISTMGLSAVYAKYIAEYSARGETKRANALLSTGLAVAIPFCAAVFGVIWVFWPLVLHHLKVSPALEADARVVVLIAIGGFLLSLCTSAFSDALTGVQKEATNQGIWIVAYLVETGLIFLFVGIGHGVKGLAEAFLLRTLLEEGLSAIYAYRKIRWLKLSPALVNRESLRVILSFGGVVQLASFFSIALNSVERVLAVPLVGLEASGLLDIGKKLPSMAASIPNAFTSSLTPAASYLTGALEGTAEARTTLHKLFLKGARYMNLSAAYFCALIATASAPLLWVWLGKSYPGAALLATVFAISTQIHLMTGPGTSVLKGLGRPREEFYYCVPNVLALLITVPLSRLLLGAWTAVGIGSAVALATVFSAAYFIRHANRIMGLPAADYWRRVALPGIVPYLVALPLALPASSAVLHMTRWRGAALVVALGAVYTALLAVIVDRWVMDQGERLWYRAVLRSRLSRARPEAAPQSAPTDSREQLIEELSGRYGSRSTGRAALWRSYWKRRVWQLLVGGARALKRGIDITAAAVALVILSPLFLIVAVTIKLTDRGPVLFWQTRVGQWGAEFPFPKFRSMVVNAEALKAALAGQNNHASGLTFKMRKDPRVTWIGSIIRKFSIDELPQLWCVLKGEMSLVGPRPPIPKEVAFYTLADRRRLDVKPGLTCTWQVSGRGDIPFDQQVQLDVQYIESQSFWGDVKLLLKTVPAVLLGKGAY